MTTVLFFVLLPLSVAFYALGVRCSETWPMVTGLCSALALSLFAYWLVVTVLVVVAWA